MLSALSAWRAPQKPAATIGDADLDALSQGPTIVLQDDDEDDQPRDEDSIEDDDEAPSFPAKNSIQRAQSGGLALPPSTTNKPAPVKRSGRGKVALEPGFSQLDWAKLQRSGADLKSGVKGLLRVTPSELAKHRSRDDAWSAYNGKVYNITPYLRYHPGGVGELMRSAGRDGTDLFSA